MAGLGLGALGGAGAVLAAEVFAPVLLLCWLCCWPDDDRSDPNYRYRSSESFDRRRFGSSAVSLHLPSTSGQAEQTLAAHRSHEEIRDGASPRRRDARYHSAPSVIHEVVHRRDWDRSARELRIPLRADDESRDSDGTDSELDDAPHELEEKVRPCKKHYANIKSSHKKENKETSNHDDKDNDATEDATNFYIGEPSLSPDENDNDRQENKVLKAKEAKQSLNESIRCKDRQRQPLIPLAEFQVAGFDSNVDDNIERDRSGAMHHSVESRSSLFNHRTVPVRPPSVESELDWELEELEIRGKETAI